MDGHKTTSKTFLKMKRISLSWFILLAVTLCVAYPAAASQVANHIRTAELALADKRTPAIIKRLIERHMDYYRAGAAGPDVMNTLGLTYWTAKNAHYKKTGELINNMLRIVGEGFKTASTEPEQIEREQNLAYTLGWITHYYLDIREHGIVNRYGGYYDVSDKRHKTLEMFETAHVYNISPKGRKYTARAAAMPIKFVLYAYLRTYGLSSLNQPQQGGSATYQAALLVQQFTEDDFSEYNTQSGTSSGQVTHLPTGHIPFRLDYTRPLIPLDISLGSLRIDDWGKYNLLKADVRWEIWDNSLIVGYMSDWYESIDRTVDDIVYCFRHIAARVRYEEGRILISPQIHTAFNFPNYDLDTGQPESSGHENAKYLSSKFKPIKELELGWDVINQNNVVVASGGKKDILLEEWLPTETTRYTEYRSGTWDIQVKLKEGVHGPLRLRVTLRMKDNDRNYVQAYKFVYDKNTGKIVLPKREKDVVEAKMELNFTLKRRDTPSIDSMVGKWNVVKPGDRRPNLAYPPLIFTKERGEFGYKVYYVTTTSFDGTSKQTSLYCYWELQGNELVFKYKETGGVTKRFTRKGEGYWEGHDFTEGVTAIARPRSRESYKKSESASSSIFVGIIRTDSSSKRIGGMK